MRGLGAAFLIAWVCIVPAIAWDSKIHPGIVRAALSAIPPEDGLRERWGDEVWRLQQYVQMGDWVNALVLQREQWHVGGETLGQSGIQFYANDYLIFPRAPRQFQHMVPDVQATYQPFFLRTLQALRMENPANAARWMGSLLHFVTDSGSPPHTIGVRGPDHTRMESGFDPTQIDLTGYQPKLLGATPEAALKGLVIRMDGLIAFSAIRARQMQPSAAANDRSRLDAPALESASETARVTADTIHTLLRLASMEEPSRGASLIAKVAAPAVGGLESLPAKVTFAGTEYSTLSSEALPAFRTYRGVFGLRNIPPGTYSLTVERVGSQPLQIPALQFKAGDNVRADWTLSPSEISGNLAPNPNMDLRWVSKSAPDHWRFDAPHGQWISDNIPITGGQHFRVGYVGKGESVPDIQLQWMSHAWEPVKTPPQHLGSSTSTRSEMTFEAPANAIFARLLIRGTQDPSTILKSVFVAPLPP